MDTEKLGTPLGKADIKQTRRKLDAIRFREDAINKVKKDNYSFGNKRYLYIPFKVSKDSHQKGLKLKILKGSPGDSNTVKTFYLVYWFNGKGLRHLVGNYSQSFGVRECDEYLINLFMIKYLSSVQKADHYVSVAATLNMKKFDSSELEQYTLTRSEYANKIGKTTNAVRMMQRHGKLSGEYRFDGNKFLFKSPDRPGDYMVNDHAKNIKLTTPKKKINRGNHFKASYPNNAFKLHNELKMLNKIKSNIPDNVLNEINPELIKLAQERAKKKQDDLIKKSFTQPRNYGNSYPVDIERMRNLFKSSDTSYRPVRNYYDPISSSDDGSVEIDLSRSRSSQSEPQFKSKVSESIWRLKNKK